MPSLETAKRISAAKNNGAKTIGQIHKENSDFSMEYTWDTDIQSKVCYIYDYAHDDQPFARTHITHRNTSKTKIDAKFIITQYGSISKDQVAYHIMFKPSQKIEFQIGDELYYFETDYRKKYDISFPISMYIDIPNDRGIYEKWLIYSAEYGNQFIKYNVLPCNYLFEWIEVDGQYRHKRRMWGVERQQLSYTSGIWRDYNFESFDNVDKAFLPLNEITKNIKYVNDDNLNQRMVISAKMDTPLVWRITKIENTKPLGIMQFTLKQTSYDSHKDYIEKDDDGNIIGMWADYFDTEIKPLDHSIPNISEEVGAISKITASTYALKVGGSYKMLTFKLFDLAGNDITEKYQNAQFNWTCGFDDKNLFDDSLVSWRKGNSFNQIRIKFSNNKSYLNKVLSVKCEITLGDNTLSSVSQFELTS